VRYVKFSFLKLEKPHKSTYQLLNYNQLEMWANAKRNGRLAEYRLRPLFNAAKVCLTPTTTVPWSNAAKTRNRLKLAGVPQTGQQISAVSEPKLLLWGHVEEILLFNTFFPKISPDKIVRWCADGEFLRHFCVLYFHPAACSVFQTYILNSH